MNGHRRTLLLLLSITLGIIGWAGTSWVRMVEEHIRESSAGYQRIRANEVAIALERERIRQLEERVRVLEQGRR